MFLLFPILQKNHRLMQNYLHSNMFLLFPVLNEITGDAWIHLHSNMFLLFPRLHKSLLSSYEFTFQYVSIISKTELQEERGKSIIYIPICFYYFTRSERAIGAERAFTFQYVSIISNVGDVISTILINLHSNMFLLFLP